MTLRHLAVVTLVLGALVALPATGGFGAATADRGVAVAVVDDEDALLGLSWYRLDQCGEQDLVTIENRFASSLTAIDLEVVATDRLDTAIGNVPAALDPGEATTVTIDIDPEDTNQTDDRWVKVRVTASGPSVNPTTAPRNRTVTNCP